MKSKVWTAVKVIFLTLLVLWMVLFVVEYFRARGRNKPLICLKEETKTNSNGTLYECISLGYKYFEVKEPNGEEKYGFGAAFIKSDIEKDWEE